VKQPRVGCNREAGSHWNFEASQGTVFNEAKENITVVVSENVIQFLGMLLQITTQALHRHLFLGNLPTVDEQPADAPVGSAILRRVPHADATPVRQLKNTRSLNVKKKNVDGVFQPGDLVAAAAQQT
jgi:hypothetical protein